MHDKQKRYRNCLPEKHVSSEKKKKRTEHGSENGKIKHVLWLVLRLS